MFTIRNVLVRNSIIVLSSLSLLGCGYDSSSSSAKVDHAPEPVTKRIMPLGDSITWDWHFDDTRTDAKRSGYRNYLWYKLENVGYSAEFVGSRTTGGAIEPYFDGDNEGHKGWTSHQIANHVYNYLKLNPSDVVLLYIGTNDESTSVGGVEKILDEIDRFEGDSGTQVQVVLALIMSNVINPKVISMYNNNLNAMAKSRIDNGDDVLIVNMENGAGIVYNGPNRDFRDGVHPNDCGYEKMANIWFTALTGEASPGITYANCN